MNTQELTIHTENFLAATWLFTYEAINNNRSSKRTDILHKGIEGMLLPTYMSSHNPNFQLLTETSGSKKIKIDDSYDGEFNVDLLLMNDVKYHTVIPAKMNMTSINKNRFNMGNTVIGETARATPEYDIGRNVLFINFTPIETLLKKTDGTFKIEVVDPVDIKKAFRSPFYNRPYVEQHLTIVDIKYSIELDLKSIKNDEDMKAALNSTPNPIKLIDGALTEFQQYCSEFLIKNP